VQLYSRKDVSETRACIQLYFKGSFLQQVNLHLGVTREDGIGGLANPGMLHVHCTTNHLKRANTQFFNARPIVYSIQGEHSKVNIPRVTL